ncbi:putative bifunctional diguanylate cyclase/phosphodiesterase [Aurantivibrio plasticivorans]
MAKPLQTHILRLLTGTLVVTTLAITLAVWVSTNTHVRGQISNELTVGRSVVERLLSTREDQLLASAEVLTADFGFKQAIASGNERTVGNGLANHASRIHADLLALVSLKNKIIASSSLALTPQQQFPSDELIQRSLAHSGASDFIKFNDDIYQIIVLPVRAPLPVGLAVIGFRVNQEFANDLKQISDLDVSFVARQNDVSSVIVSTLEDADLDNALNDVGSFSEIRLPLFSDRQYVTEQLVLSDESKIIVYLSSSVDAAFASFDMLQIEILLITFVAVIAALIGGILFARKMALPLEALSVLAGKIAAGQYQAARTAGGNIQEIGRFIAAFSRMQTDLKEREERITYQSNHDDLTKLINRSRAVSRLDEIIRENEAQYKAARHYRNVESILPAIEVIVINIRDFREINDSLGHGVGDQCLISVAARLKDLCGPKQFAARLGADEFLIIFQRGAATSKPDKLLSHLQEPYAISGVTIHLRFFLGVASLPDDSSDAEGLIKKAGIALDLARRNRAPYVCYDASVEENHRNRLQLLADLKKTLHEEDGQLRVYYQPKVGLQDGAAERFEALLRWSHPTRGLVLPDAFVPLAEQGGLIQQLTEWVVETVIDQLGDWKQQGLLVKVAVNLSAQDLSSPNLLELIDSQLRVNNVRPSSISFEITESELMGDPEEAINLLNQFREKGFELSIDDFGTGYSSLSQLKNMPVNELKIDKSFVTDLDTSNHDQIITRSTISLARSFGLSVVAEGVETIEALNLLKKWGIDWAQGYYFAKPMSANQVPKWIMQFNQNPKKIHALQTKVNN